MEIEEKVRENKLRRIAERRGFQIVKSRRKDPHAVDYGGYMLTDARTNTVVLGSGAFAYNATLHDIEEYFGVKSSEAKPVKAKAKRPRLKTMNPGLPVAPGLLDPIKRKKR